MAIKLPKRNFVTFPEVCERWQCSENDIRELIIEEQLKPSFFLGNQSGYFIDFKYDDTIFGSRIVKKLRFEPEHQLVPNRDLFYLRDPRRVGALDCDFRFCSWSPDSAKTESNDPDELTSNSQVEWCLLDNRISLEEVLSSGVVTNIEIARFEAKLKHSSEKTLATRERKSLLTIIAALCEPAGINYAARGAATEIAVLTSQVCSGLDPETVMKVLRAIPDALEIRQK